MKVRTHGKETKLQNQCLVKFSFGYKIKSDLPFFLVLLLYHLSNQIFRFEEENERLEIDGNEWGVRLV